MADEFENEDGWLECPKPPADAEMVNGMWSKAGFTIRDLVDTSTFPPKVNEALYKAIMTLYPDDGVLFYAGTGNKGMTREAWIKAKGVDPLAQLAWQRRDVEAEVAKLSGKAGKNQLGRLKVRF
ncbi:MAG: hypothetical protein QM433_11070 [Euryarchaeota archaeon]|nr:hypothetical protein [Euryarchaeota archaeon]